MQVMMETVFYSVDICEKKKQLLHQLGDLKLSPAVDDRLRKLIRDVKEFLNKTQVDILHQVTMALRSHNNHHTHLISIHVQTNITCRFLINFVTR